MPMVQFGSLSRKLIILASSQILRRHSTSTSLVSASFISASASASASTSARSAIASFVAPSSSSSSSSSSSLVTRASFSTKSTPTSTYLAASDTNPEETNTNADTNTNTSTMSNNNHTNNDKKQSFRVVSYNLLSSHLAEPTFHTKCEPKHLDAKNRFPKIIAKLQKELDDANNSNDNNNNNNSNNSNNTPVIFCLQEVSHDWATQLHTFFANNNYHFITALYGRKFNGYMGIGTAYPTQTYQTLSVDICRLSETKTKQHNYWPKPRPGNIDQPSIMTKYVWNPFYRYGRSFGLIRSRPVVDPWEKSQYRSNEFIAVKLVRRNGSDGDGNGNDGNGMKPFWVGNYHMPCAFREPAVMTIHCDLVAQRIQSLAASSSTSSSSSSNDESTSKDAFILAGDFNIMPESEHYKFLTTGTFNEHEHPLSYPPIKYGTKWTTTNSSKMKSAYALHHTADSDSDNDNGKNDKNDKNDSASYFTNYAHNGALSNESFIGTLDYIFLSDDHDWVVKDVVSLKKKEEVKDGPYPNHDEPSDHVLIAATLEV